MKLDRDLTGIYLTGLLFMMGNMLPNPIIAGYSVSEVAPLFEICQEVDNITLPASFWDIIGMP